MLIRIDAAVGVVVRVVHDVIVIVVVIIIIVSLLSLIQIKNVIPYNVMYHGMYQCKS